MIPKLLYSEQTLIREEEEMLFLNHLKGLISNFDSLSKSQIKNNLLDLKDLVERYSNGR